MTSDGTSGSDPFNLTLSQQQIWLDQLHDGPTAVYNLTFSFHIPGPVDQNIFRAAFARLVSEAECLRLQIHETDGKVTQSIASDFDLPLEIVDFSRDSQPEEAFTRWIQARAELPVDLTTLVMNSSLAILSPQRALWSITIHHIASDSWGLYLLYRRLLELYETMLAGQPVPEPRLLPFAELIQADQDYRASQQHLDDQKYWNNKLKTASGPVQIYGKKPRPTVKPAHRVEIDLDPRLVDKIARLIALPQFSAATENIALFNLLLTAYAAFLHRTSGQQHFMIGAPHMNRPGILRQSVGLTTQQVPLAVNIDPEESFETLHQKIRVESAETAKHSCWPVVNPNNQLYNVVFNYHNRPYYDLDGPSETWWYSGVQSDDLGLNILNANLESRRLRIGFDLSPQLFDARQEEMLIGHFLTILEAFADNPASRITESPLMAHEASIVGPESGDLHQWSGKLFVQFFEAMVDRYPDNSAVEDGLEGLSYRQLWQRAQRLANHLRQAGVRPGEPVGLFIDRTNDLAVGLLAIFLSSNTFVPLDPNLPTDRLKWIIEDCGIACILTRENMNGDCPDANAQKIDIDGLLKGVADVDEKFPFVQPDPDSAAYVCYTSGSTGRPKGVVVSHRQMMTYLEVEHAFLALEPTDRFLYFAAVGFDASIEEIFPTWMSGAALVMRPAGLLSLGELNRLIGEEAINVLSLPAAFWAEWVNGLQQCAESLPPHLRMVMVYAEEPSIAHYIAWKQLDPGRAVRWINTYGPTESVVTATVYEPGPDDDPSTWSRFPIGKPLANHVIYILDSSLQPVPVGTPGEIYIGGTNASGYHHLPDETARAFVADPLRGEAGHIMYKTGDRGRVTENGLIEFLGRADFQVKVNGFRIELGEIEHWLSNAPGVQQAVVILRRMETGADHLVAYMTTSGSGGIDPQGIRKYLKIHLPNYMVPHDYIFLPEFPKTPNGKIDRAALPAMYQQNTDKPHQGATTLVEEQLVALWEQVLNIGTISIDDDFFDLGGSSLLGVRLFDLIRQKMDTWLPVAIMFEAPTVRELAKHIEGCSQDYQHSLAVLLRPGAGGLPFFLIHGWGGGTAGYAELTRSLDPKWPVYGIQSAGLLNEEEPDETVEAMVSRYIKVIKSIQPAGPYRLGGYCTGGVLAYAVACDLVKRGDEVALVTIIEGDAPNMPQKKLALLHPKRLSLIWNCLPHWYDTYRALGRVGIRQRLRDTRRKIGYEVRKMLRQPIQYSMEDIILDDPNPLPDYLMKLLLAQLKAIESYEPESFPGEVVVCIASYPTITQAVTGPMDPTMGWGHLAKGGVRTRYVKGFHNNIHLPPYCHHLALVMQEELYLSERKLRALS